MGDRACNPTVCVFEVEFVVLRLREEFGNPRSKTLR